MGCLPPPPRHPRPAARALGLTLALPNVSVFVSCDYSAIILEEPARNTAPHEGVE